MTLPGLPLVLAEGITSDQLKQLAAVMLGLVVFAAVFALVERQRVRRGGEGGSPETPLIEDPVPPPPVEYPPWTPPPQHAGAAPGLQALPNEGEIQDELPVPFVPRSQGPARAAYPPAGPPPDAAPSVAPEVTAPEAEPSPAEPPQTVPGEPPPDPSAEESLAETPDDIGIIIPEEPGEPRQRDQA